MKIIRYYLLIFGVILFAVSVYAEQGKADNKVDIPPGMELRKIGDLQIIVPQGAKVEKKGKGGVVYREGIDEYVARQLLGIKDRLSKIEAENKELREEVKQLSEKVLKLLERPLVATEKD